VFNGEIHNYLKLRALLESKGHVFTTRTDTEVLLNAYVEWGENCVDYMDGMLAFAIWDDAKGRLFGARDRLGIKPFYYAVRDGHFVFGSEIKALRRRSLTNATTRWKLRVPLVPIHSSSSRHRTISGQTSSGLPGIRTCRSGHSASTPRVMRAASEAGVKVLIDGQGGDEVFGGYAKFRYAYLLSLLRAGRLMTASQEMVGMIRQGDRYVLDVRNGYRYLPANMRRLLAVDSMLERVLPKDLAQTIGDETTPATQWWRNARTNGHKSDPTMVQRIQMDDILVDTLPQLLRMEDRSSMAFSLEARVPLLDHRVVELGLSLPDRLKVRRTARASSWYERPWPVSCRTE
jgi:asparagine synthetase B (glutamine-hydrolysing)